MMHNLSKRVDKLLLLLVFILMVGGCTVLFVVNSKQTTVKVDKDVHVKVQVDSTKAIQEKETH